MEQVYILIEKITPFFNGFLMAGVIVILFGIRDVTRRDWDEYKRTHSNVTKRDEILAWGVFT